MSKRIALADVQIGERFSYIGEVFIKVPSFRASGNKTTFNCITCSRNSNFAHYFPETLFVHVKEMEIDFIPKSDASNGDIIVDYLGPAEVECEVALTELGTKSKPTIIKSVQQLLDVFGEPNWSLSDYPGNQ